MKKLLKVLFAAVYLFLMFGIPYDVNAETLADLRKKLTAEEAKQKANSNDINQTESRITQTKADINQTYTDIDEITREIPALEAEIVQLGKDIEAKDAETKELMKALQVTSGDSFYLEYIFGAESMTDFIYRYSITEQLTKHNDELIKEMNQDIEANKQKQVELANKKVELANKQDTLEVQLNSLGNTRNQLYELSRSIEDEIKNSKAVLQVYINAGCKETDELKECAKNILPPDTSFQRPMDVGYVTSEYGWRNAIYDSHNRLIARAGLHEGIDLSNGYGTRTKLYAVASGMVAKIWYDNPGGGNQVVIHHNIGGVLYSSSYAHLSRVLVKEGDIVNKDTAVGMMGATGSASGVHLHIAISRDLRYYSNDKASTSYKWYTDRCYNPRDKINFPRGSNSWYNRVTIY